MLFGDKAWGWKVAGALALVAALGLLAAHHGRRTNPAPWRCLAQPDRWDGARLWIRGATVVESGPNDYRIRCDRVTLAVAGPAPAPPGERVDLAGTFRADGLRLDPDRSRVHDPGRRRAVEAVSLLVLALVLANFVRHFRTRPSALQVRGAP